MLKTFSLKLAWVLVGVMVLCTADSYSQKKSEEVTWLPESIQWVELDGGTAPGVMTALLWGDPNGAHAGFTKFPAGFKAPLHSHTYDTKIVVIKGGYTYNGKTYGPGSYLLIPGGVKHESGGVADSETIFLLEMPGKFDSKVVDQPGMNK